MQTEHTIRRHYCTSAENGFTLMETCIAFVIMMVSALAAASLFALAIKYNSSAYESSAALAIAQQRMERIRKSSFTDASLNDGSTTDNITNAGRPYTVLTTVCGTSDCGGSAVLKLITIRVSPGGSSSLWAETITAQRAAPATGPDLR